MSKYKDLVFLTSDRMIDFISGDPVTSGTHKASKKDKAKFDSRKSIHDARDVEGWYSLTNCKPLLEPYVAIVSKSGFRDTL